ncbi:MULTISPECIES: DUF4114 domain-containing protein [Calothrix]|uniref:DUF4114 domain-containing protein n=2 Tax=Calothrix TaxID=1186 RepID=A0ABR8A7Q3_9CYAN|nr:MULTISPECIES: DUF4114 domain-containing protein [Calothrix]MBD2196022.1 DUF4114 domain-containing protein [Calothrix parietina FACHB-288]MBD2224488.1 DUF4114 domain-containing protein [Calothrix anomala FACHB-343]
MTTISHLNNSNNSNNGIFTVGSTGTVSVDFLYDGGQKKGEIAIFSLEGMENLEIGSTAFIQEATRRALSNSSSGYVVVRDEIDRARFTNLNDELAWEKDYNGGIYQGAPKFQMVAGTKFAMMLVTDTTVANIAQSSASSANNVLFSFGSLNPTTGQLSNQIADITGKGNTFGWEDINTLNSNLTDRDYNDMVVQVSGATATAPSVQDSIYSNRNWLNTNVGKELTQYANRPQFDTGTFIVDGTGQVQLDYLYDGGWYQGEVAVFSLKGMDKYQPGSLEFRQEAIARALSNSKQGHIFISDRTEGARFSQNNASWEDNFGAGNYQGVKSFQMNAGDEVAFMLVQNTTFEEVFNKPSVTSQWGKEVIFSTNQRQIVAVDNNGTIAFEDNNVSAGKGDKDFNDLIFQAKGLKSYNTASINTEINSGRDWRTSNSGQELLQYASRSTYTEGVFQVGETGQVTFDFLYDGGWYQGEMAVFSLAGMENYQAGSQAFIQEASRRALSNSKLGYVLSDDSSEGARFTEKMPWEDNFNSGNYRGITTFEMNPGDKFAFMFVPHTNAQAIKNANWLSKDSHMWQYGKLPLFSIPEANPNMAVGQMVDVDGNGTFAFEDIPTGSSTSDRDYNDFVFQIKGAKGIAQSIDNFSNSDRDWRTTTVGQQLLEYTNRAIFDEGVFLANQTGQVKVDFLYDGGDYHQGELGIFSLRGMDMYEIGSTAFMTEAVRRATSNNSDGYVVAQDPVEGARFTDNSAILNWEPNFNNEQYRGEKIYQMQGGDTFGFVFAANGTLHDALTGQGAASNKLFFSMSAANLNETVQVAEFLTGDKGAVIGFEDVAIDSGSNRDYNDFVISLGGIKTVSLPTIQDVAIYNHNWTNTQIGTAITNYFNNATVE